MRKIPAKSSTNSGHRVRLRERFKAHPDSIPDYELLELLLFLAWPRIDTKPLAKLLLQRTGSLAALLNAPPQTWSELRRIGPQAVHVLQLVQHFHVRMLRHAVQQERDLLNGSEVVVQYCRARMAYDIRERVWLLFVNAKHRLLTDEEHEVGTVNMCVVFPREVVRRALDLGATGIIIVHNHPSGDGTPSQGDIKLTKELQIACCHLGVELLDHLIVTAHSFTSLRGEKYIKF